MGKHACLYASARPCFFSTDACVLCFCYHRQAQKRNSIEPDAKDAPVAKESKKENKPTKKDDDSSSDEEDGISLSSILKSKGSAKKSKSNSKPKKAKGSSILDMMMRGGSTKLKSGSIDPKFQSDKEKQASIEKEKMAKFRRAKDRLEKKERDKKDKEEAKKKKREEDKEERKKQRNEQEKQKRLEKKKAKERMKPVEDLDPGLLGESKPLPKPDLLCDPASLAEKTDCLMLAEFLSTFANKAVPSIAEVIGMFTHWPVVVFWSFSLRIGRRILQADCLAIQQQCFQAYALPTVVPSQYCRPQGAYGSVARRDHSEAS